MKVKTVHAGFCFVAHIFLNNKSNSICTRPDIDYTTPAQTYKALCKSRTSTLTKG